MRQTRLFTLMLLFSLIGGAVGLAEDDLYYGGFNGKWEGQLRIVDPKAYDAERGVGDAGSSFLFSIEISGDSARVFSGDKRTEIKQGLFKLAAHKTNAVIYAIESSNDVKDETGSGGWVETWNITLTHKDRNSLYVYAVRSVNNYLRSPDYRNEQGKKSGRLFVSAFGELTRAAAQ